MNKINKNIRLGAVVGRVIFWVIATAAVFGFIFVRPGHLLTILHCPA
jgi:hypothetical protein